MPDYDLIIIGSGVAGRTAADEALAAGLRTAIVEQREFGGTCALRGCEPKKLLVAAAETVETAVDQRGRGVGGEAVLDWPRLAAFKRTMTDPSPAALESYYAGQGAQVLHGTAAFTAHDRLAVTRDARTAEHRADRFLIATGAAPAPLGIPGAELVADSEAFMALEQLPRRVAFVGGGYISFEFSALARAAGCEVTIVHRSERPLREFDPDLVEMLVAGYRDRGIRVLLGTPAARVRRAEGGIEVELADGSVVACDLAVHGAGRVPDLDGLALDAAGISRGRHGIEVDGSMRSTSSERVWAAGDAAAVGMPLTPVAVAQARVAVRSMLGDAGARFEPATVPSAAFTHPPLATVGLSEEQARSAGMDVTVKLTDTSDWWSSKRMGLRHTGAKTILDRATGRVLGAALLGHGADEVVNLFALAIARGVTGAELKELPWSYPTAGSEIVYLL